VASEIFANRDKRQKEEEAK